MESTIQTAANSHHSPIEVERRLIQSAYKEVEQRIKNHEASAMELTYFLKLGSTKEQIEMEILERQKDLITAKTEALREQKKVSELYGAALAAMKKYGGGDEEL